MFDGFRMFSVDVSCEHQMIGLRLGADRAGKQFRFILWGSMGGGWWVLMVFGIIFLFLNDVSLSAEEIDFAFRVWTEFPDR